jgi:hypothetical protein
VLRPGLAYQAFMVDAWIPALPADDLSNRLDVPWVKSGDLYHIDKLVETIRAYRAAPLPRK